MRRSDWTPLGWRIGVLTASGAVLAIAALRTPSERPANSAAVDSHAPSNRNVPAGSARAGGRYAAIAAHPIFEPSRQPWSSPAPPPMAAAPPPAAAVPPRGYTLVGLVMTAGHRAALLRDPGGRTQVLSEGQTLDGWRVHGIDAAGIHLRADRQRFDLTMPKQGRGVP